MDWKECLGKRIAKNVRSDEGMIKSLVKSSGNKIESCDLLEKR